MSNSQTYTQDGMAFTLFTIANDIASIVYEVVNEAGIHCGEVHAIKLGGNEFSYYGRPNMDPELDLHCADFADALEYAISGTL